MLKRLRKTKTCKAGLAFAQKAIYRKKVTFTHG